MTRESNKQKIKDILHVEITKMMAKLTGRTQSLGKFPLFTPEDYKQARLKMFELVDLIFESIERRNK